MINEQMKLMMITTALLMIIEAGILPIVLVFHLIQLVAIILTGIMIPFDEQGHGTYISGIAAAQTNNITGIAGAAPNIKLVNLRAFDPGGYGEEDDVAAAILYAVQNGVKVLNMSFGDYSFSYVLRDVVQYAYSKNLVLGWKFGKW